MYRKRISSALAFTLVEILMVLAIIGIISAVGVPAYKNYAVRSKVASAYSVILDKSMFDLQSWYVKSNGTQFFPDTYTLPKINNYVNNEASNYTIGGGGSSAIINLVFDKSEIKSEGNPKLIINFERQDDNSPITVSCTYSDFDSSSMLPKQCREQQITEE